MDDLLREFLTETGENLDVVDAELVRFEQEPNNAKVLDRIFRLVHTVKGTCGFLGLPRLEALSHAAESLMGRFRDGNPVTTEAVTLILATIDRLKVLLGELERLQREPDGDDGELIAAIERMADRGPDRPTDAEAVAAPPFAQEVVAPSRGRDPDGELGDAEMASTQSIRVGVDTLESLMTMVSELVLTRNQLLELVRRHENSGLQAPLQRLSNVTAELQDGVMKARMQPIGNAWQKLPRLVRDLALELGKEIELELHGADTELDRQVLELIKDPLIHMVRNCADHGLETPDARVAAGKSVAGTIRLSAYHQGGHVVISVADDGRGLDTEGIARTAVASGIVGEAELAHASEAHIHRYIFDPGFSTAKTVTNVSGRGVGMDVVRVAIDKLGGSIEIGSVRGAGVNFTVKIPTTLAIVAALVVETCGDRFAIPQIAVMELVRVDSRSEHRVERIKGAAVLRLRNKLLPLVHLGALLGIRASDVTGEKCVVVIMQVGDQSFGLVVDGVFHTEEIVVKPLSTKLRHLGVFSGNTILGDGSVILILDPNGVAQFIATAVDSRASARLAVEAEVVQRAEHADRVALLMFRAGSTQAKAVPLSLVTRIEEIDRRSIEFANGRYVVQYRGGLMPLVRIDTGIALPSEGMQPLLVFSESGRSTGLIVDEIVDIVEDTLKIEVVGEREGVVGVALIKGQTTEIIDVGHFLPLAYDDWLVRSDTRADQVTRTLLLVDDSAFFRNLLTPVLKAAGFEVTAAASAPEALALLRGGRRFDVLVTDLQMPGMDGFSLATAVRMEPGLADMPIIALSSNTTPEAIERGREVGFHDYVAKFDRQSLVAALKEQTAGIDRAA